MINDNDKQKVLNLDEIETQIKFLSNYRGLKRIERLKKTSLNLHKTLKSFGYFNIEYKFLLTFFEDLKHSNQHTLLKEIINFLISENKIKESFKDKTYLCFEDKPLLSFMNKQKESITNNSKSLVLKKRYYKVKSYEIL